MAGISKQEQICRHTLVREKAGFQPLPVDPVTALGVSTAFLGHFSFCSRQAGPVIHAVNIPILEDNRVYSAAWPFPGPVHVKDNLPAFRRIQLMGHMGTVFNKEIIHKQFPAPAWLKVFFICHIHTPLKLNCLFCRQWPCQGSSQRVQSREVFSPAAYF